MISNAFRSFLIDTTMKLFLLFMVHSAYQVFFFLKFILLFCQKLISYYPFGVMSVYSRISSRRYHWFSCTAGRSSESCSISKVLKALGNFAFLLFLNLLWAKFIQWKFSYVVAYIIVASGWVQAGSNKTMKILLIKCWCKTSMGFLHSCWEPSDNPSVAYVMVAKEDSIRLLSQLSAVLLSTVLNWIRRQLKSQVRQPQKKGVS